MIFSLLTDLTTQSSHVYILTLLACPIYNGTLKRLVWSRIHKISTIFAQKIKGYQGRIQEFVQGGGLTFFFFPGGDSAPVGAWKPPEINRLHRSRGGLAPIAPPLNTPLKSTFVYRACSSYSYLASNFYSTERPSGVK